MRRITLVCDNCKKEVFTACTSYGAIVPTFHPNQVALGLELCDVCIEKFRKKIFPPKKK